MKTAMINTLKKINRTVLEMDLGILFLGVSAQIIGAFIARDEAMYAKSLWFGVLLALVSTYHMYRSLDRALDQPEKTATKMIIRAYILRYVMLIFFLLVMMKTGVMNPLIFFFTYVICMKVTAFLQPSVIIQTHHVIAVGMTKSRHQCRMLSEIPGKADSLDIVIFITQIPYGSHGIVRGSIVHQKNIVFILREFLHFFPDLLHHMG